MERIATFHVCFLLLAFNAWAAEPIKLPRQVITLPANAGAPLFVDVEGHGRCNLLVIDTAEKKLLNYRQRPDGFTNAPDQVIPLPDQTAWVAPGDVDAHPGLELLMSTPAGIFYCRQNDGLFELDRRCLIAATQTCAHFDVPILTLLNTNKPGTNDLIPVIGAGESVMYHRNISYEWSPGAPLSLDADGTTWSVNAHWGRGSWTLGPNCAHAVYLEQSLRSVRSVREAEPDKKPENDTIAKIMADMRTISTGSGPQIDRMDVNGDGREDLVLWQVSGMLECRTDVYVFLRGASGDLPAQPTQVLHCRGFPIPVGSVKTWSPVHDLGVGGACELILLETKTSFTSPSRLIEMALSRGMDWSLAIRSWQHGAFSRSPNAPVPVTGILASEFLDGWPFLMQGDFNGDGRLDLLVRRSDTEWNIFCSTTNGKWIVPQAAMSFDVPPHGSMDIQDLRGDGLSDIIWHEWDQPGLSIYMSPPVQKAKAHD